MKIHDCCRLCGNPNLISVCDLGDMALSSVFPAPESPDPSTSKLDLVWCVPKADEKVCNLIQLRHTADLQEMYGATYGYRSSTSGAMVQHLRSKVDMLAALTGLCEGDAVLDIGCNDGTLLNYYSKYGVKRFGCDPSSEKFAESFDDDIQVVYDFFSKDAVLPTVNDTKFKIITSIAMFYDLDDPMSFVKDIADLLQDDGVWAFELSYLPLFLTNLSYDQACHEHVGYYGLHHILWITEAAGLKVLDVTFNEMNGGSFYLTVAKKESAYQQNSVSINKILAYEEPLRDARTYEKLSNRVLNHRDEVKEFFNLTRKSGSTVLGYGASTKGNIVLNYCDLTTDDLPAICDAQEVKYGLVTPGTRIPIISKEEARSRKPDYMFVFIWHLRREVIQQEMDYLNAGGKLVFPLPSLHIVTKENAERFMAAELAEVGFSL